MKVRYVSQKDEYNCGPTAIINLIKWQGLSASWKDIPEIRLQMWGNKKREKAMRGLGTPIFILDEFIRNNEHLQNTLVCTKNKPTIKDIKKHLTKNRAILLDFYWSLEEGGHYTLIIGLSGDRFITVNFKKGKTVQKIKMTEMQKLLKIQLKELGLTKSSCMWVFDK